MRILAYSAITFAVVTTAAATGWWLTGSTVGQPPRLAEEFREARARLLRQAEPRTILRTGELLREGDQRELTDPAATLPRSSRHDPAAIQALYQAAIRCSFLDLDEVASSPAVSGDAALAKAVVWARHQCDARAALPADFFASPPLIHPSGASYVALARSLGRPPYDSRGWQAATVTRAHLLERRLWPDGLAGMTETERYLADLPRPVLAAIVAGEPEIPHGEDRLLLQTAATDGAGGSVYLVVSTAALDKSMRHLPLMLTARGSQTLCEIGAGNRRFCWVRRPFGAPSGQVWLVTAAASLAGLVLSLVLIAASRIRSLAVERADRLFAVRTLTHELRTPVTAMALALEELRPAYDKIPSQAQEAFLRLCDATTRLSRVVTVSGRYLTTQGEQGRQTISPVRVESVAAVIEAAAKPWAEQVTMVHDVDGDRAGTLDPLWLALVLGILIDNACRHGRPPVTCRWRASGQTLLVDVTDAGLWSAHGGDGGGLGLGLGIARQALRTMGGDLTLAHAPTTFTVRLPKVFSR